MRVEIAYVHHSCFVLGLAGRALLFDWPAPEHRPAGAEAVVRGLLAGRRAAVLFSHSHADHCSPDVLGVLPDPGGTTFILSYDVPDMVPELDLPGALVVDPDTPGEAGGIRVSCLEANDLGVAFMLEVEGLRAYFSGDLAAWTWDTLDATARAQVEGYFEESLARAADFGPRVVFHNADPRLANWAGGCRAAEVLRPRLFVPCHAFGRVDRVAEFAGRCVVPGVEMFAYATPGDTRAFELDA